MGTGFPTSMHPQNAWVSHGRNDLKLITTWGCLRPQVPSQTKGGGPGAERVINVRCEADRRECIIHYRKTGT